MTRETAPERQRQQLLAALFGPDVPTTLGGQLLRTSDVAALFQVSERTVSEWARRGRIPSVRTPGGHHRYPAEQVRRLLDDVSDGNPPAGDPAGDRPPRRDPAADFSR